MSTVSDFGWTDDRGELRPRDWDEYVRYFSGNMRQGASEHGYEHKPQTWAEYCHVVRNAPDWTTTKRLMEKYHHLTTPKPRVVKAKPLIVPAPPPVPLPPLPPRARPSVSAGRQAKVKATRLRLFRMNPHCFLVWTVDCVRPRFAHATRYGNHRSPIFTLTSAPRTASP